MTSKNRPRYAATLVKSPELRRGVAAKLHTEHEFSFSKIGKLLGVSKQRVHQMVADGLSAEERE